MPDYRAMTRAAGTAAGLDPVRFERQIGVESINFNLDVIECRRDSGAGARGIAQLMPVHWSAVDPCNPAAALAYAAGLVRGHLDYWRARGYAGDVALGLALASYNAGRQATIDGLAGKKPGWPFAETVRYLTLILDLSEADARSVLTSGKLTGGVAAMKLSEVLARARSRTGDPYVWGGKTPPSTDCSGFVSWAYNGLVPSFTDAIYDATQRVETPAPGDIVLYQYADPDQPTTKFPHVGLYLDDATVLDNRFGMGVGVHPQLARTKAARYYRRLSGVAVDTVAAPAPADPSGDPGSDDLAAARARIAELESTVVGLKNDLADRNSKLGAVGVDYATQLRTLADRLAELKPTG